VPEGHIAGVFEKNSASLAKSMKPYIAFQLRNRELGAQSWILRSKTGDLVRMAPLETGRTGETGLSTVIETGK
jgi:hypothetical protein